MANFPVGFNFRAFDNIGRTIDRLNSKFDGLKGKITQLNNRFEVAKMKSESFRRSMQSLGNGLKSAGRTLTFGVTLPLAALGARFVKVSSDAEETKNKFNEVFKGIDDAAKKASVDKLTGQFKLSTRNAQDFLSTTGLIAKGLDLNSEQALDLSTELASLSQDVASFRNVQGGAEQVVHAFNSALVGERERLKTLGIVITEADVKAKALELAQKGVTFETVKQAKALSTLALIQDRTKDDLGDFQRTQHSFSNQLRITAERFDELSRKIGDVLLPVAAKVLAFFNKLQEAFLNLSPRMQKIIILGAGLAAALGPLLLILGTLVTSLAAVKFAAAFLGVSMGVLAFKFIAIAALIAGLIAAGVFLVKNWEKVKAFFLNLWDGPLVRFFRFITGIDAMISLAKMIMDNWKPIKGFFVNTAKAIVDAFLPVKLLFEFFFMSAKKIGELLPSGGSLLNFGKKLLFGEAADSPFQRSESAGERAGGISKAKELGQSIGQEVSTRLINDARVRVDFNNMPRGTRVQSSSSGIPPELNLGMAGAGL